MYVPYARRKIIQLPKPRRGWEDDVWRPWMAAAPGRSSLALPLAGIAASPLFGKRVRMVFYVRSRMSARPSRPVSGATRMIKER